METSQDKILNFCLKNCIFDGWTKELLENACKKSGLDANYWQIPFPEGVVDVIDYYSLKNDEKLAFITLEAARNTAKIREAVKRRVEMNGATKEPVRSMFSVYALHPVRAVKATYRTVDAIWRLCGDTATDWNFYTKRLLLSGVYTSTLLFWLNDKSENNAQTWEFLDRRLEEVGLFNKGIGKVKEKLAAIKMPI